MLPKDGATIVTFAVKYQRMKSEIKIVFSTTILALGLLTAQCGSANGNEQQTSDSEPTAEEQSVKNIEVVSAADFANRLSAAPAAAPQLLDVRTPKEQRQGVIEGARFLDFSKRDVFANGIDQLDKNQPVFVYCAVGGRSAAAARMLAERGFRQVIDLQGGIDAWKRSGNQTVIPNGNF